MVSGKKRKKKKLNEVSGLNSKRKEISTQSCLPDAVVVIPVWNTCSERKVRTITTLV
jgi:hypothetical protein